MISASFVFLSLSFLLLFDLPVRQASIIHRQHERWRRQLSPDETTIELNSSVPYIFSARLYPYGDAKGDVELRSKSERLQLKEPMLFMGTRLEALLIRRDGAIGGVESREENQRRDSKILPLSSEPLIAVFWRSNGDGDDDGGRVMFRETKEESVLNLAQNEVNIQYRYGTFQPRSVVIVTWEKKKKKRKNEIDDVDSLFQAVLILGSEASFIHLVYSRLRYPSHSHTLQDSEPIVITGFNGPYGHYSLPGSGTRDVLQLAEKSDIGIPGEWMFRVDGNQTFLCGSGFKGVECIDQCEADEWGLDCSKDCHCENGMQCDSDTGHCPNDGRCTSGWTGSPICDQDVDECRMMASLCPPEQPDCLNSPGAFLCVCFEYENSTGRCKTNNSSSLSLPESITVPRVTLRPQMITTTTERTTTTSTHRPIIIPSSTSSGNRGCGRCDENAHCQADHCVCKPGWTGDGHFCVDVNECFLERSCGGGDKVVKCLNTPGSFKCVCQPGYRYSHMDLACLDLDECLENPCHQFARCSNQIDSFECTCIEGYIGNGIECRESILFGFDRAAIVRSSIEIHLDSPVMLFGEKTSSIFVSPIGAISTVPITSTSSIVSLHQLSNGGIVFAPFIIPSFPFDVTQSDSMFVEQINDINSPSLKKATNEIRSNFFDDSFNARSMLLITFHRAHIPGIDELHTFQTALVSDSNTPRSYVFFFFEELESNKTQALSGIVYPRGVFSLPRSDLTIKSNVNRSGKWIYRIDEYLLGACPAGTQQPPLCNAGCAIGQWGSECTSKCHCHADVPCDMRNGLCATGCAIGYSGVSCQLDVDECAQNSHNCSRRSNCFNVIGGFECHCHPGHSGPDCLVFDQCEAQLGRRCSPQARCIHDHGHGHGHGQGGKGSVNCVCSSPYIGNGFLCSLPATDSVENHLETWGITESHRVTPTPDEEVKEYSEDPFLVHDNWLTEAPTAYTTTSSPITSPLSTWPPVIGNDLDLDHPLVAAKREEESDTVNLAFIIVPAALCGVWLLLIVIVMAVCCRNSGRKRKDAAWTMTPVGVHHQAPSYFPGHFSAGQY